MGDKTINDPELISITNIPSDSIIIGFTGAVASGCSEICEKIINKFTNQDRPYKSWKLSSIIDDALKDDKISNPSLSQKQDKGNELRKNKEPHYLALKLLNKIDNEIKYNRNKRLRILLDGIKNHYEIYFLRNHFPNFFLFSVQAPREIRKERWIQQQMKDENIHNHKELEKEFILVDERDEHEDIFYGQQVHWCNYLADINIFNDKNFAKHASKVKEDFYEKKIYQYVELIENHLVQKYDKEIYPNSDELCMTLAYAISKKSSCCKRKVGAVIIETIGKEDNNIKEENIISGIPIVTSSGYNEVLLNTKPCILDSKYNGCYRDLVKKQIASRLKYCPYCNEKLDSIIDRVRCSKCDIDILETIIRSSDENSSNFLDICRAIHAEEMAILQLSKRGSFSNNDLTLYTTAQPCNLCAKKIITMQNIKKVVYSEPYDKMNVVEMMQNAGIEFVFFEGVKGLAFYKLYFSDVKLKGVEDEKK